MENKAKNIDNYFHKDLDGLGELPPAHIWDGVVNALDGHGTTERIKRDKKNRYALLLLLMLITASAGTFWLLTGEDEVIHLQAPEEVVKNDVTAGANQNWPAVRISRQRKTITGNQENIQVQVADIPSAHTDAGVKAEHAFEEAGYEQIPISRQQTVAIARSHETLQDAPRAFINKAGAYTGVTGITAVNAVAGFTTVKKPRAHRFSLTAFFAPDITTRNLEQEGASTKDEGKDEMKQTEKNGALDFTFGARVDYKLNKHFSIQSGLSFSTNTIDIAQKTIYARYDKAGILRYRFNMSSGYCFFKLKNIPAPQFAGDSARTMGSTSTLHYINIPLIAKYNFAVSQRLDLTVQAGIVARFIAWESISTTYDYFGFKEKSISRQIEGLKKNYFNGVVGIGAEYAVNKKVALTIFPSFNFATSSINKDAPVKAYPNTLSVATGVKFTF